MNLITFILILNLSVFINYKLNAPRTFFYDLNNVTYEELLIIPEIDEEIAESILNFRSEIGYYNRIDDLLFVRNISENIFKKLRRYFYIKPPQVKSLIYPIESKEVFY